MGTQVYELVLIALSAVGVYAAVILYTRLFGLRSFSKMSSFDFAATVAIGSLVAGTIANERPTLAHGALALLSLYTVQWLVQRARIRVGVASELVDNTPVLIMYEGEMREDAMRRVGISKGDLYAKLREANVHRRAEVRAVVLETTGDVSVLHGEEHDEPLDPELLAGVVGSDEAIGHAGRSPSPS